MKNNGYELKLASGLVKSRFKDSIESFTEHKSATALLGDRFYFSALCGFSNTVSPLCRKIGVKVDSPISEHITVTLVEQVPVRHPDRFDFTDDDYISHEEGLYPDLLRPFEHIFMMPDRTHQLYFEVNVPETLAAGDYPITISLIDEDGDDKPAVITDTMTLSVLPARLPAQELNYTQWIHYDCLAVYYGVEIFSERHWEIIESFIRGAVKTGITAILTPVFTPPLDTAIGGERPTVQLVDVTRENGTYTFGFEKLKRFCDICERAGARDLEIAHFFTQWGAKHAPKIMAHENGEYRRIFGWDTDATSPEYTAFLRALIPALREQLDAYGFKDRYFFHISDEPIEDNRESYEKAKNTVWDLISDRPVRDALSHYSLYESGVVRDPVPAVDTADEFVAHNVPDLWVYYCSVQGKWVSNRYMTMPGHRTRVIGAQMYKTGATGFLHWGYNFYFERHSLAPVNPFLINDANFFVPAGDAFSVYPAPDGTPWFSLRTAQFEQAIFDMRAMRAAEAVAGREAVLRVIDPEGDMDYKHYPKDPDFLIRMRERLNKLAAGK